MARWTTTDSEELYNVPAWGVGYFGVNPEGHLTLRTDRGHVIDLKVLVDDLQRRGIALPVLLRFTDLVRMRIEALVKAFEAVIAEYEYKGSYRGVYPVKVNQQRHLVDDVVRFSAPHHLGLEAGSKPELLIALAYVEDPEAMIICNGYKDPDYIEMALLARKLGRNCIVVVEQAEEVDMVLEAAAALDVHDPVIGVRAKLSTPGAGRWKGSAGHRAKFGLTIQEIVDIVERLRREGKLGMLQLLHFHIGSQITAIRSFKTSLREATRIYTELRRMGADMKYIDVGGGLGVDYDGSRTNFESSMNYDMQEYAYAVISSIRDACDEAEVPHPHIITESGRAMVAHNSVLVFPVLGVSRIGSESPAKKPGADAPDELQELWEIHESITAKSFQEPFHDAVEIRENSLLRFQLGLTTLEDRAEIDRLFWGICKKILRVMKGADYVPDELQQIERDLADTYFCNFSVFQSAPDSWAISQLFPIVPIQRLDEEPTRSAVLADITCDSDGKVDRFIDKRDVKHAIELHDPGSEPYYIAMFLLGAYQEILGDLHNLFGDTNAVHVSAVSGGLGYRIDHVVEGDTVKEVLEYVQYDRTRLVSRIRAAVERAYEEGDLSMEDGARLMDTYLKGLEGYTYLGKQPPRLRVPPVAR